MNANSITQEQYQTLGFRESFGTWVRTTDLHVCIVVGKDFRQLQNFGVYVFHGHPGGQFWRNDEPLVRCDTMEQAQEKAKTLYGITGSQRFASIINL
jgi:hypothetical protein